MSPDGLALHLDAPEENAPVLEGPDKACVFGSAEFDDVNQPQVLWPLVKAMITLAETVE